MFGRVDVTVPWTHGKSKEMEEGTTSPLVDPADPRAEQIPLVLAGLKTST